MADETGKTGQGDASKQQDPLQGNVPLPKPEDIKIIPPAMPVSQRAIPALPLDDLLAPDTSELPPSKIIPPISVMPSVSVTPTPTPPPPAHVPPNTPPVPPAPATRPVPPEVEPFIRKTTQPTPPVSVPVSDRITPVPLTPLKPLAPLPPKPAPITPPTSEQEIPEPVILSETVRPKESPVPPGASPNIAGESASAPNKSWGPFSDNISNILNAIKLPERFDAKASGDIKTRPPQKNPEPIVVSEKVVPTTKQPAAPIGHSAPVPTQSAAQETPIPDVGLPSRAAVSTHAPAASTPRMPLPDPGPFMPPPPAPPPAPPQPTPVANPAPAPMPEPAVETAPDHSITPLRTFKEDLMHVVHDRKISLVSAAALEQDKKRDLPQPTPAEIAITRHKRRRIFAVLYTVVILIGLSAAALYGVYTVQTQHATPAPNPNNTSIIFAEQTFSFPLQDLTPNDIKRTLSQSSGSSNPSLGSITRIVPTVKTEEGGARLATTAEFFKAIDLHVSDDLVRALSSEFFLGIHTIDKNSAMIIIPVYSYERAFAGMLDWEAAMNTDLAPAFTPVSQFTTDENGLPKRRVFEDVVMRNYDTRALKDDSGTVQLYYSFPTPNVLIISENPFSFTEILSRLQVQRRL